MQSVRVRKRTDFPIRNASRQALRMYALGHENKCPYLRFTRTYLRYGTQSARNTPRVSRGEWAQGVVAKQGSVTAARYGRRSLVALTAADNPSGRSWNQPRSLSAPIRAPHLRTCARLDDSRRIAARIRTEWRARNGQAQGRGHEVRLAAQNGRFASHSFRAPSVA